MKILILIILAQIYAIVLGFILINKEIFAVGVLIIVINTIFLLPNIYNLIKLIIEKK